MSLFAVDLSTISYEDVKRFVDEHQSESVILEYKRDIKGEKNLRIEDTVAAFANTNGGLLILGVEEKKTQGRKTYQVCGVESSGDSARSALVDKCLDGIWPPVFLEPHAIQLPKPPGKVILIARIRESENTPHATHEGTRVYLRADGRNYPISGKTGYDVDIRISDLPWLQRRREKAIELRTRLIDEARNRHEIWRKPHTRVPHCKQYWELVFSPRWPISELARRSELLEQQRRWFDSQFTLEIESRNWQECKRTESTGGGIRTTLRSTSRDVPVENCYLYLESGCYGLIYLAVGLPVVRKSSASFRGPDFTDAHELATRSFQAFHRLSALYEAVGYQGETYVKWYAGPDLHTRHLENTGGAGSCTGDTCNWDGILPLATSPDEFKRAFERVLAKIMEEFLAAFRVVRAEELAAQLVDSARKNT